MKNKIQAEYTFSWKVMQHYNFAITTQKSDLLYILISKYTQ